MKDNMDIWNAVEKTDPKHTKAVNQRGGFTAIGANYQIMNATKQFGPIGIGWGYTVEKFERMDSMVIAHVTFWHGRRFLSLASTQMCSLASLTTINMLPKLVRNFVRQNGPKHRRM